MLLQLTGHLSAVYLPPATIRILFQFLCRAGPLQQMFMLAVADIMAAGCRRREFPAVLAVPVLSVARCRAISASSSDSGLCSIHSSSQTASPLPPFSGMMRIFYYFLSEHFFKVFKQFVKSTFPCAVHRQSKLIATAGDLLHSRSVSLLEDLGQEFAVVLRLKLAPDIRSVGTQTL